MVNLVCLSFKGVGVDRKPISSTEHIYKLYLQIVRTMVPVVGDPLVGLDPVLRDRKAEFKEIFMATENSFKTKMVQPPGSLIATTQEIQKEEVSLGAKPPTSNVRTCEELNQTLIPSLKS